MKYFFFKLAVARDAIFGLLLLVILLHHVPASSSNLRYRMYGGEFIILEDSNLMVCPSKIDSKGLSKPETVCKTLRRDVPTLAALCLGAPPYLVTLKKDFLEITNIANGQVSVTESLIGLNVTAISCSVRGDQLDVFLGNFNGQVNWLRINLPDYSTASLGEPLRLSSDTSREHADSNKIKSQNISNSRSKVPSQKALGSDQPTTNMAKKNTKISASVTLLMTNDSQINLLAPLDSGNLLVCGAKGASIFSLENSKVMPGAEMIDIVTRVPRRRLNLAINPDPDNMSGEPIRSCGYNEGTLCVARNRRLTNLSNEKNDPIVDSKGRFKSHILCQRLAGQKTTLSKTVSLEVLSLLPSSDRVYFESNDGIYDVVSETKVFSSIAEYIVVKLSQSRIG